MEKDQIRAEMLTRLSVVEGAARQAYNKLAKGDLNLTHEMGEIKQYYQSSMIDWEALKDHSDKRPLKTL